MSGRFAPLYASITGDVRRCWRGLLLTAVAYRGLAFFCITPLVALLSGTLLAVTGGEVVADEDILRMFLRPSGLVSLVVMAGLLLAVSALELACLMTISMGAALGRVVRPLHALRRVLPAAPRVLAYAVAVLLRLLLVSAPFLAAAGIVYLSLLSRYDINFYLSTRPPEFWLAAILLGLLLLAMAALLIGRLIAWAHSLPILIFEGRAPRTALSESVQRSKGRRLRIGGWLLLWLLASTVLSAMVVGPLAALGRLLIPRLTESLALLALAIGTTGLLVLLAQLLVSVLSTALLSAVLNRLYLESSDAGRLRSKWLHELDDLAAARRVGPSGRTVGWLLTGAIVLSTALAAWVLGTMEVLDETQVTAHRGASAAAPENTLAAVRRAIEDGADWVEIDVQTSADGVVVVAHDRDLQKVAGVALRIAETPFAKLSEVDVGSHFGGEFRDERIPRLEQVLELCRGRAKVNIELKYYGPNEALAPKVVSIVEALGMSDQVAVMSLNYGAVQQFRALRPDWPTGLLAAVALSDLRRAQVDFLAVSSRLATGGFVRSAHRAGRQVHAWTVNDTVTMSTLISRGVDNLITDRPALARAVLRERANMSPLERLLVRVGLAFGVRPTHSDPSLETG